MTVTVTIGYGDGSPLETELGVDLLVDGAVVATAYPDDSGQLVFEADVAGKTNVAVRMHPPPAAAADAGADPRNG